MKNGRCATAHSPVLEPSGTQTGLCNLFQRPKQPVCPFGTYCPQTACST
ncbi:MAG: hypothetical protein RL136_2493 [Planctomycetota bacterium]|jgi:hypothetical protein